MVQEHAPGHKRPRQKPREDAGEHDEERAVLSAGGILEPLDDGKHRAERRDIPYGGIARARDVRQKLRFAEHRIARIEPDRLLHQRPLIPHRLTHMRRIEVCMVIVHADLFLPERFQHRGKRPVPGFDVIAVIRDHVQRDRDQDEEQTAPHRRHQKIIERKIDVLPVPERQAEDHRGSDCNADEDQQRSVEPRTQEDVVDRIDAVGRIRLHDVLPLDIRAVAVIGNVHPVSGKMQRDHTEHEQHRRICDYVDRQFFPVFLRLLQPVSDDPHQVIDEIAEIQRGKPCAGIEAGPFRRRAEPEHHARKTEQRELFPVRTLLKILRDIVPHEQEHKQCEEQRVGVDRRNARLRKVHAVRGKQPRGHERIIRTAEDALCKHVQHRKDQNAEECTGKPPAERRHSEDPDADGNEQLAQRRVRPFIDRVSVPLRRLRTLLAIEIVVLHDLVRRARMVDLIEIHSVEIRMVQRDLVLFVQKPFRAVLRLINGCGQQLVAVQHRDLVHGDPAALHIEDQILRFGLQRKVDPFEHITVFLFKELQRFGFARCKITVDKRAVVIDPELALGNAAEEADLRNVPRFAEIDEHGRVRLRCPCGLRRAQGSEIQKSDDRVYGKQDDKHGIVAPGHAAPVLNTDFFPVFFEIHPAHLRFPFF